MSIVEERTEEGPLGTSDRDACLQPEPNARRDCLRTQVGLEFLGLHEAFDVRNGQVTAERHDVPAAVLGAANLLARGPAVVLQ
jgi:hypothetical protein